MATGTIKRNPKIVNLKSATVSSTNKTIIFPYENNKVYAVFIGVSQSKSSLIICGVSKAYQATPFIIYDGKTNNISASTIELSDGKVILNMNNGGIYNAYYVELTIY